MIKLEVGKTYELNNGEILINGMVYHESGRFANRGFDAPLSVKRCIEEDFEGITVDSIAQDSLKWHYENDDGMEPIEKEAFRIVMRYYGMSF